MRKRMIAWLLCAAMIISLLPVAVVAQESAVTQSPKAGGHSAQQHTCEACEATSWQPWPTDGTIPEEGHYYLTQNVQLDGMVSVKADKKLHICLNGYVMTATQNRRLFSASQAGAELVITDCTAGKDENQVYQAGALTGGDNALSSGGGAVYVATGAVFKLYDGRITGNISRHNDAKGGAIVLSAKNNSGTPGGMFFMYGGEISNNTSHNANQSGLRPGGAVYINNGAVAQIKDGVISGNRGSSGGAFNVQTGGELILEDSSVTGNTGTNGSAVYGTGTGAITIINSQITGNTGTSENAVGRCAAIFTDGSGSKVTLSGKVIIADNTMAVAGIADLVMSATKGHTVYIKDMEPGSRVNFRTTAYNPTEAGEVLQLDTQQTAPWQSSWLTYTNMDGISKIVGFDTDKFVFLDAPLGHVHGTQEFVALSSAAQLESGGYYYLDSDLQLDKTAVVNQKDTTIHLCLNGHDLTPAEGERLMKLNGTRNIQVVIDDCTAHTDGDGVYHAGSLRGADNEDENGGLIQVGSTDVVTLKNGKITGNKGKSGGAIILDGTFVLEGGQITENSSVNNGGAVYVNTGGTFRMSGGLMQGNKGKDGSAVAGSGNVELTGGVITGNQARGIGTVTFTKDKSYILQDITITGNEAQSAAGVYVGPEVKTVTLGGNSTIIDNQGGNLYLTEGIDGLSASGLTGKVGVTLSADRIEAGHLQVTTQLPDGVDLSPQFTSDSSDYVVTMKENRVTLKLSFEHKHCICGTADCTEHEQVEYLPWSDSTSLPKSGCYCLTTDVQLQSFVSVNESLKLCLNGHTITAGPNRRIFSVANDGAELVIGDCTAKTEDGVYTAGKLTGGANTFSGGAGAIYVATGAQLVLYDGIITNNKHINNAAGGGAILLDTRAGESSTGGRFYMYGGEISNNQACNESGEPVRYGGAIVAHKDAVLEIRGGRIFGNTAASGGAIYANNAKVFIENASITDNTAGEAGGGILALGSTKLTVSGKTVITGNTAKDKTNNLELTGELLVELKELDQAAAIGVTAVPLRYISEKCDDYTANITSDHDKYQVSYRDGAIYLDASGNHKHCFCKNTSDRCEHTVQTYIAWDDPTALPNSGNYYLTVDVTISRRVAIDGTTLNLCLNGHTITTEDTRVFYLYRDGVLRISDCGENTGKITGATSGAIMADKDCENALVELYGGSLCGNESVNIGGAILIQGKTTFNMYGGIITDNAVHSKLKLDDAGNPVLDEDGAQTVTSKYGGGGVGVYGKEAKFYMYGGQIIKNESSKVVYLNKDGAQTNGGGFGGGVHCDKGSVYIYGGLIADNTTNRTGGGLFIQNAGTLEIHGGKISNNHCEASGGGFYLSTNCILKLTAGEITGNSAKNAGGFHCNTGAQITMSGGTVSGNTTTSSGGGIVLSGKNVVFTMTGGQVTGNYGTSGGGVLAQSGATLNLHNGKIANNQAKNSGGGIYISGDSFLNMKGGSVTGNHAKADAGGIMLVRCTAKFSGGYVSYNSSEVSGGGMKASGAKVTAYGLTMEGNTAQKHAGAIVTGSSSKTTNGVKVTYYLTMDLNNCTFRENTCQSSGGALLLQSKGSVVNLENCSFIDNSAKSGGGGFYVSSNVAFTMTGGQIKGNYAAAGGAARLGACQAQISGVLIQDNESKNGGALYMSADNGSLKLSDVQILDNKAVGGSGGGAYLSKAVVEFNNVKVNGNSSTEKSGGAIYLTGRASLTMNGGEISNNNSVTLGGAVYTNRGTIADVTNVEISNNTCVGNGGAINSGGSMRFTSCRFTENKTEGNGGAICTNKSGSQWTQDLGGVFLTDCEMSGNTALVMGGALFIDRGGPAYMNGVVCTGNSAVLEGNAIYADGIMEMTDVTVTENLSDSNTSSAVYVGTADWDGHSYTTGMRKLSGTVIIKDNQCGDLYLDQGAVIAITGATLGENSHICVKLSDGLLTQRVLGVYDYEGSDLDYVITPGSLSMTQPMEASQEPDAPTPPDQTESGAQEPGQDNTMLYVGIGAIAAVVLLAAVAVILVKKKKSASAEHK